MNDHTSPDETAVGFAGLPIQPTGSGVADLEIAYEQAQLADGGDLNDMSATRQDVVPTAADADVAEAEAHPS